MGSGHWTPHVSRDRVYRWGSRRRKPAGLAPFATVLRGWHNKSSRETGSTTWARNCHGFDSVKSLASPFEARRVVGQQFYPSRKRQSSSEFAALKPAGGRVRRLERPWQVVHGLHSRLLWFRVRYCLGLDGDCWGGGRDYATTWTVPGPKKSIHRQVP